MLPTKFRFILPSGFREDDIFQKSTNQKQELPVVAMFVNGSEINEQSLLRTFQGCFHQISIHLAKRVQRRRFFRNQLIRNKNCLWWPCLLTDGNEMSILYRGPSKDASYRVSIHLAKWFQRRQFFRNQPIRNKNCLWRTCLLTDRDEMSNLYREPSIYASYQVLVHLAMRFQRRRFSKIGQSETRIAYGGHVC